MSTDKKLSFEEAIEQLDKIVEQLEEGDVPLEEAISIYKNGMELSKLCHDKLKHVEKQLIEIVSEDGEIDSFSLNEED